MTIRPVEAKKEFGAVANHTPGPWRVDWDIEPGGYNNHIYCGPDDRVCFMAHNGPEKQDEWDANARLIAAAPDILAALKEVKHGAEYPDELGDLIDAAIAKAEPASAGGRP